MSSRNPHLIWITVFVAMIAVAAGLVGCATSGQAVAIPLPRVTPFGHDPIQRMTYLDAFRDGYLAAKGMAGPSVQIVPGRDPLPYELGYRAGVSAAREPQREQ